MVGEIRVTVDLERIGMDVPLLAWVSESLRAYLVDALGRDYPGVGGRVEIGEAGYDGCLWTDAGLSEEGLEEEEKVYAWFDWVLQDWYKRTFGVRTG